MGTYDTKHGGAVSPCIEEPYIFPLEGKILGLLENAGIPEETNNAIVVLLREALIEQAEAK